MSVAEEPRSFASGAPPGLSARPESGTFDVFVSYARDDEAWVHGFLLPALEANDIPFSTMDGAPVGMPMLDAMSQAIEGSNRVLIVISPAFMADLGQQLVSLLAQHYGMEHASWPVIPLMLRATDLPLRLRLLNPVEAFTTEQARNAIDRICQSFGKGLVAYPRVPPCPYPGMQPYEEADREHFRGREEETESALSLLRLNPVLFVVGASGSGKSSLVRAGILPHLRESGAVPVITRPGSDPIASITDAMIELDAIAGPRVLVIDQLEEIFTGRGRGNATASAYWAIVGPALGPLVKLIATVRADFYPQLLESPLWPTMRDHRLELVPMDGRALRRAIVPPAHDVGVYIESALVERLVQDADLQPGSLPFVQETLLLLWDKIEFRYLPLSAYQALVLPRARYGDAPRTGLQIAMASRADAVMAALPSDSARRIARRVLLRLVQFGDGRADTRRQQPLSALSSADDDPELFDATVARLVEARLLTSSGNPSAPTTLIDLSHEALIVGWPALQGWIEQRREAEMRRRALAGAAADWDRLGHGPGGLLDEVELHEAERWLATADSEELGVERNIADLVAASRRAVDQANRRRRRTEIRLRALTLALTVLLLTSAGLGWNASEQRDRAEYERATAQSNELARWASTLPPEHLDRALLLSQEAIRLRSTPLSRGSLLDALGVNPRVERMVPFPSPLTAVATSDDGGLIAVGDAVGTVSVLNAHTMRPAVPPQTLGGVIHAVAFAPGGRELAAASSLGAVGRWTVEAVTLTARPALRFTDSVRALAYSGDDRWLAVGGADATVTLVDRSTGEQTPLAGHLEMVNSVAFTSDSRLLVSAGGQVEHRSTDGRVLVREVASGRLVTALPDQGDAVRSVAVSPDDTTVAAAGADGQVRLWDLATAQSRVLSGHADRVFGVAYTQDGSTVVSAGRDQTVQVWDVRTASPSLPPLSGHGAAVRDVAIVPGTGDVVSVGTDARLIRWDLGSRGSTSRLAIRGTDDRRPVRAVAAARDGALVATGDDDGIVTVRRSANGEQVQSLDTGAQPVWGLAFGPRDALAVSVSTGDLAIWNAIDGTLMAGPVPTGDIAPVVAVAPDGTLLAAGGDDGIVRLFDSSLNLMAESTPDHRGRIIGLAFSSGTTLVSASADDRTVFKWMGFDGGPPTRLVGTRIATGDARFTAMSLSADGGTLATGDVDGKITLWDVLSSEDSRVIGPRLIGHDADVTALGFTSDGSSLVSADTTGSVRLWSIGDGGGQEVGILGSAPAARSGAVVGRTFVEGTDAGSVRWPITEGAWAEVACEVAGRNLRSDELTLYLGFDPDRVTCPDLPVPPHPVSTVPSTPE